MIRGRTSALLVLAVALLAVAAAGCRVQAGAAYFYGDERVSTNEIEDQIAEVLDDEEFGEELRANAGAVRQQVVLTSIGLRVYRGIAEAEDIDVDSELIDRKRQQLSDTPRPGWPETMQFLPIGLAAEFLALQETVTIAVVEESGQEGASDAFTAMVNEQLADNPVTVNPRYGRFDPERIRLVPPENPAVKDRERPQQEPASP